jgi:hypothetical protein
MLVAPDDSGHAMHLSAARPPIKVMSRRAGTPRRPAREFVDFQGCGG